MESQHVKIQGLDFEIPLRYTAGHTLTEGEASALNQTYFENIRNNVAGKLRKLEEAGTAIDHDEWKTKVSEYASSYEFGVRAIAVPLDPVETEAHRMAKAAVKAALSDAISAKQLTGKLADYKDQMEDLVKELLDSEDGQKIRKEAEKAIKSKRNIAASVLSRVAPQASA